MSDVKVIITGDASGLEVATKKAQIELGRTAIAAQKTDSSLVKMGNGIASTGGLAQKAASNIGGLTSSLISGGLITAVTVAGVALFELGRKMFDVSEGQKMLNESLSAGQAAYVKTALDIHKVKDALQQAKEGTITKERALKIYNKTLGDTLGYTNNFNEAEENTIKNGPKLLQYTILKAAANYALGESAKAAAKAEMIRQNTPTGSLTFLEKFWGALKGGNFIENWGEKWQDNIKDAAKEEQKWQDISTGLDKKAKAIADDIKLIETETVGVIKKKTAAAREYNKVINLASTIKGLESGFDKTPLSRATGSTIEPVINVKPRLNVELDPAEQQKVLDAIQKLFDDEKLLQFQERATAAINETISNVVQDSLSSTSDAIVAALTGSADSVSGIFDNLIKGIGGQIKELGKYLVKIGVEMLLAKNAIKTLGLSPQGAIIAGLGLQILGGILSAAATKKTNQTGFASGTTGVQESGFYNVGERGQERIFLPRGTRVQPHNEVQAFGGGGQVFIPAITLRGSDLVIAFNRAEQSMSRNG